VRSPVEHQRVCLPRLNCLGGAFHPLAFGGNEIARTGLYEVAASSAKDPVESSWPGVADPVVARSAEKKIAPCSAYDQVVAAIALDPVVAEAAVEALDSGADVEAGVVVAEAAPDQIVAIPAVDCVGGAFPVESVVAALSIYAVGRRSAHYRVRAGVAHEGGKNTVTPIAVRTIIKRFTRSSFPDVSLGSSRAPRRRAGRLDLFITGADESAMNLTQGSSRKGLHSFVLSPRSSRAPQFLRLRPRFHSSPHVGVPGAVPTRPIKRAKRTSRYPCDSSLMVPINRDTCCNLTAPA
jgi:hypothetical protein